MLLNSTENHYKYLNGQEGKEAEKINIYLIDTLSQIQRRQWHPTPVLCLENPMDGGAWYAVVHDVAKSRT